MRLLLIFINIFQSFKYYTFDIQLQFPLTEARLHSKDKLCPNGLFRLQLMQNVLVISLRDLGTERRKEF